MKFWWLVDTPRVAAERAAVEALAQDEKWFQFSGWQFHQGQLAARGTIVAHGHGYQVQLIYPDQFPDVPAWVEPQEEARWSRHQYGKSTLCLELRPDNWVPSASGADVLRSAYNLISIENPMGEGGSDAPSAHNVGELQMYEWGDHPVLVGAGCRDRIIGGSAVDLKALRWLAFDGIWPSLVHDEEDRRSARRPPGADINTWRFEGPVFVGHGAGPSDPADRAALAQAGVFEAEDVAAIEGEGSALVLFQDGEILSAFQVTGSGKPQSRQIYVLPEQSGLRSGRTDGVASKSVAIVGLGSIGSKIAEHLVRSGIEKLRLVDGDVLLPGNIERHVLDWRDVGFRKAHGLKRRLLNIMPGGTFLVVAQNLNWQRSASTHAFQVDAIATCDVIVDATGDPATSLFLGAVADGNSRAFFSVEAFEGGIGALIATSFPNTDPPYSEGRAAFLAWCDEQGSPPPEPGPRPYEALAEDGAAVVADDASVSITAASAARLMLDYLDGLPRKASWVLLGYRSKWLFDGFGHTIRLDVGSRRASDEPSDDPGAKEFVTKLLAEHSDAHRPEA